jgi:hypothetical protein
MNKSVAAIEIEGGKVSGCSLGVFKCWARAKS